MHFFFDENFPLAVKHILEDQNHLVSHALDYFPNGTSDEILFHYAQKKKAVFLTTDKDFFHTIPFLSKNRTAAVIVIALKQPNRKNIVSRLKSFLHEINLELKPGNVYLITDTKIIVRN